MRGKWMPSFSHNEVRVWKDIEDDCHRAARVGDEKGWEGDAKDWG